MKKLLSVLAVVALFSLCGNFLSAQTAEDAKFKKFQDNFWDAYFKFFPTQATIHGYPKYNDRLEDLSEGVIDKFHDSLDSFNSELISKIDKTKLSFDLKLEHEIIVDFIDQLLIKFERLVPWEYNPLFYNEIIVESTRALLAKGTTAANVKNAAARIKAMPGLIQKARENLKTPAEDYTRAAIEQMPAIIDFYKNEVSRLSDGTAAMQTDISKTIAALEEYRRFLQNTLLPKSTGNFRLGEDHQKMLRSKSQGNLSILDDIVARSRADFNNIRREMFLVCIPFYKIMYPHIDIEQLGTTKGEEATRYTIIQGVLDKIKTEHIEKGQYLNSINETVANLKAFIKGKNLFDPPSQSLKIEPMPPYFTKNLWTYLMTPGAFEQDDSYTLFIKPIPDSWTPEQVKSFLEEHNNYYMSFMVTQDVFPGTFVPTAVAFQGISPLRKINANQALIKGWPVYLESILVEEGFNNYDLRTRLHQLKSLLKNVILFQMDLNVHQGTYTKDKVVDYMMKGGFMTEAEAALMWKHIVLNPGDAALPYIGYQEIIELEKDLRRIKGQNFDTREFMNKILSYGPISLRAIRTRLIS